MGKHQGRKQSYVRVEKEDPSCVWTVFRLMNYHPWHNVKKMLPYVNQKSHKKSFKTVTNESLEFHDAHDFEEDTMTNYSASVTSSPSRNESGSRKRSIKARIKALLADRTNKSGKVNTIEEHELLALKEACTDFGAPTLISLLKANPKLLATLNPVDTSTNLTRATSVKRKDSKEEYVGVLELFKVDQDVFLKILQDSPPKKKHRLMKSGSFPFSKSSSENSSTLGRTPSKLENKHNEVWPTPNPGYELRKAKSHNIVRSSSLKDSLDKYGHLIDTSNNNNNNKRIINKELSKSLKLRNEKDFALGDQHGRRSFRERMFMPEDETEAPRASLDCFLNLISRGDDVRVLRLDSPPGEVNGQSQTTVSNESSFDKKNISTSFGELRETIPEVEIVDVTEDHSCHKNEGISSVYGLDDECHQDQIECIDWPILEESSIVSHSTSTFEIDEDVQENQEIDNCSENLQYVKYVLDVIGFTTTSNELLELEAWHSPYQPLDPALFDGIEICCPFEPKPSSNKEMLISSFQRKILFDLINEALFVIHENSYAYYPKALTYSCVVHPELKGRSRVVEQVWEFVDEWLTWTPEVDVDHNVAVAHDLSRHKSGWSNIQTDSELLAIDLEDWIFSELLEEIVCS